MLETVKHSFDESSSRVDKERYNDFNGKFRVNDPEKTGIRSSDWLLSFMYYRSDVDTFVVPVTCKAPDQLGIPNIVPVRYVSYPGQDLHKLYMCLVQLHIHKFFPPVCK